MKSLLTIIKYTLKQAVTKKSFIVVNIIMILIIVLLCNIPNIIKAFKPDDDGSGKQKIQIVDNENLLGASDEVFSKLDLGYEIKYSNSEDIEGIKKLLKEDTIDVALVLHKVDNKISYEYMVKEKGPFSEPETTANIFTAIFQNLSTNKILADNNVSPEILQAINTPITYEITELEKGEGNDNFPVAMISAYILFFAIYFYGYSVSTSVSSEKTSRVMETLVTSTTPSKIVIGKTIAMGIVGLGQLVGLILVAIVSYKAFVPADFTLINNLIGGLHFGVADILICIVYFVLGYTVYAFLSAVTGATVSKVEDVQAASTPISLIAMISFFLAYFTSTMPNSVASKFASIFPFSAAFSMPGRILSGAANAGDIAISIVVLAVTVVVLAFISIKVYSNAILHYGDRLKLKDLFKMYKQK